MRRKIGKILKIAAAGADEDEGWLSAFPGKIGHA